MSGVQSKDFHLPYIYIYICLAQTYLKPPEIISALEVSNRDTSSCCHLFVEELIKTELSTSKTNLGHIVKMKILK